MGVGVAVLAIGGFWSPLTGRVPASEASEGDVAACVALSVVVVISLDGEVCAVDVEEEGGRAVTAGGESPGCRQQAPGRLLDSGGPIGSLWAGAGTEVGCSPSEVLIGTGSLALCTVLVPEGGEGATTGAWLALSFCFSFSITSSMLLSHTSCSAGVSPSMTKSLGSGNVGEHFNSKRDFSVLIMV